MDLSGRNHESPIRALRSGGLQGGLGDMTPDWGSHVPGQTDAMALQQAQYGYRPTPNRRSITEKFQTELAAGIPDLQRAQRANEATNFTGQAHPIQDVPYFGDGIYFSTTDTAILAGGQLDFPIVTVLQNHQAFLRSIQAVLISANAQQDLRLTLLVNGNPFGLGLFRAPLVVFTDIVSQANAYIRLMQGQTATLRITNDGAGGHNFRVSIFGWQYLASKMVETARGAMPK